MKTHDETTDQPTDHFDRLPESVKKTVCEKSGSGTGLPDALKAGIETLSGLDLSEVRVHRNSLKAVALNAASYTVGNDIHIAPGQEKHLAHEAWHVVQQKQVLAIADDASLAREADIMGAKALHLGTSQR